MQTAGRVQINNKKMISQNSPVGRERNGGWRGEERAFNFYLHLSTALLLVISNCLLPLCLCTLSLGKDIKYRNSASEANVSVPNKGGNWVLLLRNQGPAPCFPDEDG